VTPSLLLITRKGNKDLDRTNGEGTKLVLKCSKIKRWNLLFQSLFLCKQTFGVERCIEKFRRVDLIVLNASTRLETLTKVNFVLEDVINTNLDMKKKYEMQSLSCAVPRLRNFYFGFDLHLKEFKTLLLNKEVLLLLLVAPWLQKDHFGRNALLGLGN